MRGQETTDYVLDASMFVRELRNGATYATYLVGPREPEYRRDDQTGSIRWYCYDGLGSVLGEVDPSGNLTRSQSFDVYGCVRTSQGTATSKHKFVGSLGHPSEDETGLIYMRARYMDPQTGRFVSEDPQGDGGNWFSYCYNNPANYIDRTGASGEPVIMLGGGWGIRIDGPPGALQVDMHIWHNGKEIGSIWNSGAWKHVYRDLSRSEAKELVARLQAFTRSKRVMGWARVLGRAGYAFSVSSVGAYFEQNPLDFIAIMFDISGDHETAAQIDHLNQL